MGNRLRCENPQVQELIRNCRGQNINKTELCVDSLGNTVQNKTELVQIAITNGILPRTLTEENIRNIANMSTFEDLCNLNSANAMYNSPDMGRLREPLDLNANDDVLQQRIRDNQSVLIQRQNFENRDNEEREINRIETDRIADRVNQEFNLLGPEFMRRREGRESIENKMDIEDSGEISKISNIDDDDDF